VAIDQAEDSAGIDTAVTDRAEEEASGEVCQVDVVLEELWVVAFIATVRTKYRVAVAERVEVEVGGVRLINRVRHLGVLSPSVWFSGLRYLWRGCGCRRACKQDVANVEDVGKDSRSFLYLA